MICGGPGTRLDPITKDLSKSLVPVKGKPILFYIIEYWRQFADEFIFIVNYRKEAIVDYVRSLGIKDEFIEESGEPKGIALALSQAEGQVGEKFILVLGDCLCRGDFIFPDRFDVGVGVWATDDPDNIRQSYSVELKGEQISKVVEKPTVLPNDLCGLGFYFFSRKIFEAIRRTRPSGPKQQIELTNAIQSLIDSGVPVSPIFLEGEYLNLTYPEDIKKAEMIL